MYTDMALFAPTFLFILFAGIFLRVLQRGLEAGT
jgi:hypothetical protein